MSEVIYSVYRHFCDRADVGYFVNLKNTSVLYVKKWKNSQSVVCIDTILDNVILPCV